MSELWQHQARAMDDLRQAIADGHKRIILKAPTGAGKTRIAGEVVKAVRGKGNRVAFVVPAISLVDQTLLAFDKLGVEDIGVIQADHHLTDWAKDTQICSIQTIGRRDRFPKASVVIFDEIHVFTKAHKRWLDICADDGTIFIGLSATPWRKGLGQVFDVEIDVATIGELQDAGVLVPSRTFAASHPDMKGVRTTAGEYNGADLDRVREQCSLTADVIDAWRDYAEDRPTICFAVNCAHAQELQRRFMEAGINAAYIDAYTPQNERAEVFKDFEAGTVKVLCNVDCVGMGVDLPSISCVSYARPTRSTMRFVQNIGRGLRAAPGKTDCLVLDHSDTTLRLGFVEDCAGVSLSEGELFQQKPDRDVMDRPKKCPQCTAVMPPKAKECPSCGAIMERKAQVLTKHGDLVELDRGALEKQRNTKQQRFANRDWTIEQKAEFLAELRQYAYLRGYKPGFAAMKYREAFGVFPNKIPDWGRIAPSEPTLSWLKSRQIAWAKSKRRQSA